MTTHTSVRMRRRAVMLLALGLLTGVSMALTQAASANTQEVRTLPADITPAQAPATDAADGPYAWQQLAEYNEALLTEEVENGPFLSWPVEKKYEWQQRELDTGYTPPGRINGLPREGDISQEEALDAVLASGKIHVNGVTGKALAETYSVYFSYNVIDPGQPMWEVHFEQKGNDPYNAVHTVYVDPVTAELTTVPPYTGPLAEEVETDAE